MKRILPKIMKYEYTKKYVSTISWKLLISQLSFAFDYINTHDLSILCNAIEHGKITVLLTKFGIQYF